MDENPRRLALAILGRIERDGAYANLALRSALDKCSLDRRDRAFTTELVYGTTRMRRACDHLVDRFLERKVEARVRTILRLGAYQLYWTDVPAHAAVDATVSEAPKRVRGLCNAVLRKVASNPPKWNSLAVQHSYPDWLLDRLMADLEPDLAIAALENMNKPIPPPKRVDGYHQDLASQQVADLIVAKTRLVGEPVLDLCGAPGGKATAIASAGLCVVASDISQGRLGLVEDNCRRLGLRLPMVVADGRFPPFRPDVFGSVLVDAPCSGIGVLRRRADLRWRVSASDVDHLVGLQVALLCSALPLVSSGGVLVYSVCTLTAAETIGVDELFRSITGARPAGEIPEPWRPHGTGGLLLPQDMDSEGMAVFMYQAD